jgi:hypothetical protein
LICDANNVYLAKGSLPEAIILKEPTKMKASPISIALQYWREKIKKGEDRLDFIQSRPEDQLPPKESFKGKGKEKEYVNIPDSVSDITSPVSKVARKAMGPTINADEGQVGASEPS